MDNPFDIAPGRSPSAACVAPPIRATASGRLYAAAGQVSDMHVGFDLSCLSPRLPTIASP